MKLHQTSEEFRAAIAGAAELYHMQEHIIEKDYWVTMLLQKIAEFEYKDFVIFKGGTSLSKGYKIIQRFSEDIDLGLTTNAMGENGIHKRVGDAIYKVIKKLKMEEFTEIPEIKDSEKKRYKRAYAYPKTFTYPSESPIHDKIILEVNAFSEPAPYENVYIQSIVGSYIGDKFGHEELLKTQLDPFQVCALIPERTFCEKLLAIRASSAKGREFIIPKVRHIYDIYYLYRLDRVKSFIENEDEFEKLLRVCYKDDEINQKISDKIGNNFKDIEIYSQSRGYIKSISAAYQNLRSITFDNLLPSEEDIIQTLNLINDRLLKFEF